MTKILFLLSGLTLLLAWLYPNHFFPWSSFYNEFLAAIALLLLASATSWRRSLAPRITVPHIALVLMLVALLPLAQLGIGVITFSGDAWMATLYVSGLALAYLTGYQLNVLGQTRRYARALAGVILAAALVSVLLAAHQWLQSGDFGIWAIQLLPGGRPAANLSQPNLLATLLCLAVAAAIYLRASCQFGLAITALLMLLLFAAITMTLSRTPLVILPVIIGWVWWNRDRLKLDISILQIVSGVALFVLVWLLLPTIPDALLLTSHANGATVAVERTQSDLRPILWAQLLDAALQGPLFGYGWNQVSSAQISVATDYQQSIMVQHSHNIVLDLLIWNGLLVGGVLVLMLAWWLLSRLRHCPTQESWFALMAIMIVGTHGLLEYPLEYTYFLFPLGVLAGMTDRTYGVSTTQMSPWMPAGVVLLGWFTFAAVSMDYLTAEEDFRRMRFETIGVEPKKPADETVPLQILNQIYAYTRFTRSQARENMSAEEIAWMGRVAHRYPHAPVLFRHALALGLNHRYDDAALELERLQRLHMPRQFDQAMQDWAASVKQYPVLENVRLP